MHRHRAIGLLPALALIAAACGGGSSAAPTTAATQGTATGGPSPSVVAAAPTIGPGEGALNLIIWAGYAEDGSNVPEYDWVHPFEQQTGCKVNAKPAGTSDEMVSLMRQGGGTVYDGVSASGDATLRLIANGDVAAIDTSLFPDFADVAPFLQTAPHYVVGGVHYGVPHGWGGNSLMYRTDVVTPAPTSWDVVFDPTASAAYKGKITDYDSPIYIADAALYLKAHQPDLGITDPYELNQAQFDAAVNLLKAQRASVGDYWSDYAKEIDNFTNKTVVVGTTWPYQVNTLLGAGVPVNSIVPSEGMTGWADTWMMSSHAAHPNCMLQWMGWMLTPAVQAMVAESFGESPANPKACDALNKGVGPYKLADFCTAYHVTDQSYYGSIAFWKTPVADCGDSRGQTCIDYSTWTSKWTEIKG
ncbi:MAG TPA: ABC transporter substrate-binding protein [Candidatus Acidoferrales bacterium]|nr:ABC transporter substrate-binding protein [Candidatus Acidoferrales bacterium]